MLLADYCEPGNPPRGAPRTRRGAFVLPPATLPGLGGGDRRRAAGGDRRAVLARMDPARTLGGRARLWPPEGGAADHHGIPGAGAAHPRAQPVRIRAAALPVGRLHARAPDAR